VRILGRTLVGAQVILAGRFQMSTDTDHTSLVNPLYVPLYNLPAGAYTLVAKAVINGQAVTKRFVFANLPRELT
jgi:hypothetical protein